MKRRFFSDGSPRISNPGVSEQALLVNWQVFSGCARKLQQSEDVSESRLDALRAKIGLTSNQAAEVPGSSAGLPEGSPVVLIAAAGARFRGTVIEQGPLAIAVRLSGGVSFPGKGVRASLYFHNSAGIYSFPTTIVDLVKDVVRVEQSSTVTFHQPRRKCLRRKEFPPDFCQACGLPGSSARDDPSRFERSGCKSDRAEKDHDLHLCSIQAPWKSFGTKNNKSGCQDCLTHPLGKGPPHVVLQAGSNSQY